MLDEESNMLLLRFAALAWVMAGCAAVMVRGAGDGAGGGAGGGAGEQQAGPPEIDRKVPGAPAVGAALEELVSERPSFTQSTEIAPRGWFQWESGVSLDRTGPQRSVALGAPLLRVGVHRRFEVRLGADGYRMERQLRGRASGGLSDINVGFKYKVLQEQRWRPAFAIIPFLSLPTGHSRFTSGTRDPTVKLAWAKDAPLGMSVSGNVNMASLRDKAGRYTRRAYSVAVGREVVAGLAAYGEVYHFSSQGRDTGPVSVFQTGFTYAVGSRTQLDMSVARRLTRQGPDFVVMFGWVTRQPFMLVVNKLR